MCGIVAYIGNKNAFPRLIKGLSRLEYRGYDSAGIALIDKELTVFKKLGKVKDLVNYIGGTQLSGTIGIGHTRWATHGIPNDVNAHPHTSENGKISLVHNGIIENYQAIKTDLELRGYTFKSDTDTEVVVCLIEDIQKNSKLHIGDAVRVALSKIVGAYAIVVLSADQPDRLIAARRGSPMVLGLGEDEYFISSDPSPIIEYTDKVIYLNDEEIAVITLKGYEIRNMEDVPQSPYIQRLDLELEAIEKGGYDYFMLKEIFEQPQSVADAMRGRLSVDTYELVLGGIQKYAKHLVEAKRIVIIACGTSWHAGLVAEYLFEDLCRIPVEVEYASEFRYRNPIIEKGNVIIAISQSGETADTLAAIELAKSKGAIIFGIVNSVGSSISRLTHEGAYLHTGPEIGVASTKAFTGQLTLLIMIALRVSLRKKTLSLSAYQDLLSALFQTPHKIKQVLEKNDQIKEISEHIKEVPNCLYLGRGYNFPVALEGALKLKEISYIHAEGYPAAEMKHGPIALVDENMPVIIIATRDKSYDKIVSNIQEIKARKGVIIAVVTKGDRLIPKIADFTIEVPDAPECLMPLLSVIPLQLLSYHIALLRGCDVDQPRNLAKSVTVE
tara:strand:+ start:3806 stop:5641 length:1836 start_codon:yes stop_codon:yes gene_type:complete